MSTELISKVNRWLINIQFGLFPGTCIHCKRPSERPLDLCLCCQAEFKQVQHPCLCCGLPLQTGDYKIQLCGSCLLKAQPFSHIVSAFAYTRPVSTLISRFKYQARLANGRVLTQLLLETIEDFYCYRSLPELLIPMPLHVRRLRERGFNQAMEIARPISRALQIRIDKHHIIRNKHTLQQKGLGVRQRHENLRKAFSCRDGSFRFPESVAIIDDVVTTTASVRALCRLLQQHGASDIHVWSLARASRNT